MGPLFYLFIYFSVTMTGFENFIEEANVLDTFVRLDGKNLV